MISNKRFRLFLVGVLIGSLIVWALAVKNAKRQISFKLKKKEPSYVSADSVEQMRREAAWRVVKAYSKNDHPIASKLLIEEARQLGTENTLVRTFILQGQSKEQSLRVEESIRGGRVESFKVMSTDRVKLELNPNSSLNKFSKEIARWNYKLLEVIKETPHLSLLVELDGSDLKALDRALARFRKSSLVLSVAPDILESAKVQLK